jgi:hypothetical protein
LPRTALNRYCMMGIKNDGSCGYVSIYQPEQGLSKKPKHSYGGGIPLFLQYLWR